MGNAWTRVPGRLQESHFRARGSNSEPDICEPLDRVHRARYGATIRGRFWQRGQKYDERFMNAIRRIGVPQRPQGTPSCP